MPVDRELAYESLKWVDPEVYRAYLRLRYREVTDEEFQRDITSFYKLHFIVQTLDVVDSLEQKGLIEILNDYENERILVRVNQYIPKNLIKVILLCKFHLADVDESSKIL